MVAGKKKKKKIISKASDKRRQMIFYSTCLTPTWDWDFLQCISSHPSTHTQNSFGLTLHRGLDMKRHRIYLQSTSRFQCHTQTHKKKSGGGGTKKNSCYLQSMSLKTSRTWIKFFLQSGMHGRNHRFKDNNKRTIIF